MSEAAPAPPVQTCYRHGDRRAGVRCQRCDRPICPSCMHQASVGFHCPECTRGGAQRVYSARSLATRPLLTQALVAVNVIVFVVGLGGGDAVGGGGSLFRDGALYGPLVDAGEWYRLLTAGFLHAGLIHLGFNMFVLWNLGGMLEPAMGRMHFALTYGTSLLAGSLGVMVLSPTSATVGASGAVFGLMGAALAAYRARGIDPFQTGLGTMVLLNLLITFTVPRISIGGHVGGLIGGVVCGYLLEIVSRRQGWPRWLAPALVALLGATCFVASLAIAEPL